MQKTTELSSNYDHLEKMSTIDLLTNINLEDQKVAIAVKEKLSDICILVDAVTEKMKSGGRLFYIGAGTSGRLGIVDASECPPTFGIDHGRVVGLIAGGDGAIRKAVEFAEDDGGLSWDDLQKHDISDRDFVIGIAASGTTPYVVEGLKNCRKQGIQTGCICCNEASPMAAHSDFKIEVIVGPEFVTGSTRMKAGTAQKLVLNLISTSVMIKLGHVKGNKMVDMQLSNNKLVERGSKMIQQELGVSFIEAGNLLKKYGSVRNAINAHSK